MSVVAIIPVRSLIDGKTRLTPVLDGTERYKLNARLLAHTLRTTAALAASTMVVSRCLKAREMASASGAQSLFEVTRGGLNPALNRASKVARARGAARILVLPADLPFVCLDDLHALIWRAGRAGAAIAPDQLRGGTNALCIPAGHSFRFRFGVGSFFRHQREAEEVGLDMGVVCRPSLAFDVDWPSDFSQLRALEERSRGTNFTADLQNIT